MEERSFDERARLSAPGMRTFHNIALRWQLSRRQQAQILACDTQTLGHWVYAAQQHKPLVLETGTLLRLSAALGVFSDLRQFLAGFSGALEERKWLLNQQQGEPFNGRAPLEVLCGSFEEQVDIRRYLQREVANRDASAFPRLTHPSNVEWIFIPGQVATPSIQAVCFDGFGTLVEIAESRRPFHSLIQNEPSNSLARYALTNPIGLRELSLRLTTPISEGRLAELEADLAAELSSVRLRPGMAEVWRSVKRAGLRTGLCSNLAQPYGEPLLAEIPGTPDAVVLSFQANLMKPQPEIYNLVCNLLGLEPRQVLFVGDSIHADVVGPDTIGAFSMPIGEFERSLDAGASLFAPRAVSDLVDRIIAAGSF